MPVLDRGREEVYFRDPAAGRKLCQGENQFRDVFRLQRLRQCFGGSFDGTLEENLGIGEAGADDAGADAVVFFFDLDLGSGSSSYVKVKSLVSQSPSSTSSRNWKLGFAPR